MVTVLPPPSARPEAWYGVRECGNVLRCNTSRIWSGVTDPGPPCACNTSAAIPPTWGVAALVPKKFGKLLASWVVVPPGGKKVVYAPSIPAKLGRCLPSGVLNRLLLLSKQIEAG